MSLLIKISLFFLSLKYFFLKLIPSKKKVVFLSRQDNSPSIDFIMLSEEIKNTHQDYEIVFLCKKLEGSLFNKLGFAFFMIKQMYHIATAKVAILDSYIIPISVLKHKPDLLVIQIWHSVGTMKKFGYSILDKYEGSSSKVASLMKMHKNYDYILAAGHGYVEHLMQGFNYPREKIVVYPLPRIEKLLDSEYIKNVKNKIFKQYPKLNNKINIVYTPTFRKDETFLKQAIDELINEVDFNKYNLIIKLHPLSKFEITNNDVILDKEFSSMEMVIACDITISDYSCIIYEAAVLKKQIYLYTFDYDDYMSVREVYLDYKNEMPGPICDNAYDLMKTIEKNKYDNNKLEDFLNKYVEIRNNHQTKDIVEFIFNNLKK